MFYEYVLVIRPDLSEEYVTNFVKSIEDFIQEKGGKVHETEQWGLRALAYRIGKFGKAHYICLGIETNDIKALDAHLRYNQDLLRFLCIKQPSLQFPTKLRQTHVEEGQNTYTPHHGAHQAPQPIHHPASNNSSSNPAFTGETL